MPSETESDPAAASGVPRPAPRAMFRDPASLAAGSPDQKLLGARNLYIATIEPGSGMSLAILGVMEMLSARVRELGFYRPFVRLTPDGTNDHIDLVRHRHEVVGSYRECYGMTREEASGYATGGRIQDLIKRIVRDYKELEERCQFVLCEGTDFSGFASSLEFDLNAQIANHLNAPVLIVANGQGKTMDEMIRAVRAGRQAFASESCTVAATVLNRVDPAFVQAVLERLKTTWMLEDPVYVVPEDPTLGRPTVAEVARAMDAEPLQETDPGVLNRDVSGFKVAAMHVENFLEHIEEGCIVITPGDRIDIILSCLATAQSENYPQIAGIFLTGGFDCSPTISRLLEGIRRPSIPLFVLKTFTYDSAINANSVKAHMRPDNERKIMRAVRLFADHVDHADLEKRVQLVRSTRMTPLMFEYELLERARAQPQRIVLPEGWEPRILKAAEILAGRGVAELTILGKVKTVEEQMAAAGIDPAIARIIDPADCEWQGDFAYTYYELRKHKGVTMDVARDVMQDVSYFGTMMVHKDLADGMVSGSIHSTAHTIRPSLEFIRAKKGYSVVSSVFFMCLPDRVLVYGDCAVNPNPNPQQLADIAINAAETARQFGLEARVAMLSYSTGESGSGEDVDKVREATAIARERRPELLLEGPMQYDAAVDAGVAKTKIPDSKIAGRATILIFPDLNTGNNTYKAVQRSAQAVAIGPVLQGLNKPVNDLSRGCTVTDIVNTVAITAIQAQGEG